MEIDSFIIDEQFSLQAMLHTDDTMGTLHFRKELKRSHDRITKRLEWAKSDLTHQINAVFMNRKLYPVL